MQHYLTKTRSFVRSQPCPELCCCRTHRQVTRATNSSEFGSARRRVTDSLLVFNAVMFAAQLITKQGLTVWGAKVLSPQHSVLLCCAESWLMQVLLLSAQCINSKGRTVEADHTSFSARQCCAHSAQQCSLEQSWAPG